jgi:hypothetical protein
VGFRDVIAVSNQTACHRNNPIASLLKKMKPCALHMEACRVNSLTQYRQKAGDGLFYHTLFKISPDTSETAQEGLP